MENEKKSLMAVILDLLQDRGVDRTDQTKEMVNQLIEEVREEASPFIKHAPLSGRYKSLPCLIQLCKNEDIIFMMPKGWGAPKFVRKTEVVLE